MVFKVILDNGKPSETQLEDERAVKDYLKQLGKIDKNDYGYFDIYIYDSLDNDVSDYFFKLTENNHAV